MKSFHFVSEVAWLMSAAGFVYDRFGALLGLVLHKQDLRYLKLL